MNEPDTDRSKGAHRSTMSGGLILGALVVGGMLVVAACGNDDTDQADPAAVLADYEDARNEGDVDALMALYADDAVIVGHPLNNSGGAQGVTETRLLERGVPSFQRSTDATEFINLEVSGNTVTFEQRFFNDTGECFGSNGNIVTVKDGRITRYQWGDGAEYVCE